MHDFIQLPEAIENFNAVICKNYDRKKRTEPIYIVCKNCVMADLYFVTVDRRSTFHVNRHFYRGLALEDNFLFEDSFFLDESDQSKCKIFEWPNPRCDIVLVKIVFKSRECFQMCGNKYATKRIIN